MKKGWGPGRKVLDFDPEDSSLGGHVNKKLWNHQALRLGVWGPFWGGGQQSRTTLFLLGPSLVHLCRIQISHQNLLRNEQPLGSVCLLRKTKKSCQKGNTTQRRQDSSRAVLSATFLTVVPWPTQQYPGPGRWSGRQGRSLHDGGLTGNGGVWSLELRSCRRPGVCFSRRLRSRERVVVIGSEALNDSYASFLTFS